MGADERLAERCPGAPQFNDRFPSFAGRGGHIYPRLSATLKTMNQGPGADIADQLGRFGMAIAVIALIATGLYQFSGSISVVETRAQASSFIPSTSGPDTQLAFPTKRERPATEAAKKKPRGMPSASMKTVRPRAVAAA